MHKLILYITALTLFTACSGTRNLAQPDLQLPETIGGATDSLTVADMAWWDFYTDPTLQIIISRTLEHNRDLLVAAERVNELQQLYGVEKLNYAPTVNALVGGLRETNDYANEKFVGDTELSVKATLNWEIDLWGGLSASKRKAAATYMASVEDKRAMEMTLIAEAATAYFNLVALQNELNIVRQTLSTRQQALDKALLRFEGGMTSEIVYQQAKVEYATTAALVPGLVRRMTLAQNAISLLMGEFPQGQIDPANSVLDENLPQRLPTGVPSTLLERRPDIRAAEQRLKGALAGVGVAYSNQFPRLRIGITGGWENDEVKNIFSSPFSYLIGNITGTVLDFGRNRRKYKASIAAYNQARYTYEKTVLAAFTETENAVVTYREMQNTAQKRAELRDAAMKYVNLANKQYIAGSINYIDVLDAHRRYFDAQISLSNAVRDEYLALVTLYKALGGGWNNPQPQ